jgi:gliding motility-associated-like protein
MKKLLLSIFIMLAISGHIIGNVVKGNYNDQKVLASSSVGFEENKGQFTDEFGRPLDNLLFRFRANEADVYITETGLSYVFTKSSHKHEPGNKHEADSVLFARVDVLLKGATISKYQVAKELPLETEINYYNQYCPNGIKAVKQYRKIVIKEVYKGIDWVWYISSNNGVEQMKYDFIIHPFADPNQIKMLYKWADIELKNNELFIKTPISTLREGEVLSLCNDEKIDTRFVLNENEISFDVNAYDHSRELVIDPPLNLVWGTYFGGNAWEKNTDLSNAIDANGNVFVTGNTGSTTNFPTVNPGGGAYFQGVNAGGGGFQGKGGDICILKFSNIGALIWCTYYGGSNGDNGNSVAVDNNGNVYVVGSTLSTNFPLMNLPGAYNLAAYQGGTSVMNEGGDAVILKFSNTGVLLWGTYYGGSANDVARSVITDAAGNVFMTGWTESTNFPLQNPGSGAYYQATSGGQKDAFLVKFNAAGQQIWSTYYGGSGNDVAHYIANSGTHNFVVGETTSTNFPLQNPGSGAYFQATYGGSMDAFIIKTTTNGVNIWSTYYGGSMLDVARGCAVSNSGAFYVTGSTASNNLPLLNPGFGAYYQATKSGAEDVFFAQFTFTGSHVWSTYYGGNADDDGCAITTDACGNVYATGNTYSTDLPLLNPGGGAFFVSNNLAMDDVFFVAFSPLNNLIWSTYNGTTGFDEKGTSLKVDNNGNLFIVGYWCFYSNSNAYLPFPGAYNKPNTGADDFFIAKFNIASCTSPSYTIPICYGTSTVLTMINQNNLGNPSYSIQPGGQIQTNPNFTVSPSVNTVYTLYVTGTNSNNIIVTNTLQITVLVLPAPNAVPLVTQATCANPSNSVNIGVTFAPSGSPNYTTTWSPFPQNFSTVNSATASGLAAGPNSATITSANGCSVVANFTVNPIPLPADFIIINPSNNYTITCNNPNVLLTTSVTNGVPLTYTWYPTCASALISSSYNFTQQCTGQVVGSSSTGCLFTQTFTIYQNYATPTIVITPTLQNITCLAGAACFTLTSNMGPNVTTNWYQVSGTNTVYVGVPQGTLNIFCPTSAGIFWGESVNNLTGCRATRSVVVTASTGVPQFTVTSPTNFTIGCASTSITAIQVTFVQTDPANQPVNYAFVPPPGTATPVFTNNPNLNNITVPGTYVVYVRDITNNCTVSQSISIIQNTIQPNIDFIQPLSILSCKDPSMVLNGISNNQNVTITWTVPASPSPSVNPTANTTVTIKPSVSGATSNVTVVGIFTVGATDNNNQCRATKTVQINQDIRLPVFTISALTNSVINCKNSDVLLVPIVSTLIASQLVPTYTWYPPVGNVQPGTSYNTTSPGSHTAISMSSVNGCTTTATYIVASDFAPPAVLPSPIFTLDCNTNPTVALTPSINGPVAGLTFSWTAPPGALTSNLTGSILVSNTPGDYHLAITNTVNGCKTMVEFGVMEGGIHADFIPSPATGFAPLSVTFNNISSASTNSTNIVSIWGYGNGAITQTLMNTQLASTTYSMAGTYSVILKVQKGSCTDTAMRIIRVELPSALEVPNIFTPNGDKVNDVFKLRASNLSEIYIIIHDRWGNRVYEVTSETGNFAWDGNNLQGGKCADGVYFYIIKAKGADGEEYDLKGHVTLLR